MAYKDPDNKRLYYLKNKKSLDEYNKLWNEVRRLQAIESLGNLCKGCGESDPIVLQFDHINNDGAKDRKKSKTTLYNDVLKIGASKYQLLCCNCNWRKEYQRRQNAIGQ